MRCTVVKVSLLLSLCVSHVSLLFSCSWLNSLNDGKVSVTVKNWSRQSIDIITQKEKIKLHWQVNSYSLDDPSLSIGSGESMDFEIIHIPSGSTPQDILSIPNICTISAASHRSNNIQLSLKTIYSEKYPGADLWVDGSARYAIIVGFTANERSNAFEDLKKLRPSNWTTAPLFSQSGSHSDHLPQPDKPTISSWPGDRHFAPRGDDQHQPSCKPPSSWPYNS